MLTISTNHLDLLPEQARHFLVNLLETYHDTQAVGNATAERLARLTHEVDALEARLALGKISPEDHDRLVGLRRDRDALRDRARAAGDAHAAAGAPAARVAAWLQQRAKDGPAAPSLVDAPLPVPQAKDSLPDVRDAIAVLSAERAAVASAPPTKAELEATIRQQVAQLAALGRPTITRDGKVTARQTAPLYALAWSDPDGTAKRLLADAIATGVGDLDATARAARLAELDAAVLDLERTEEALIRRTPGAVRRPNASPLAVLSVTEGEPVDVAA